MSSGPSGGGRQTSGANFSANGAGSGVRLVLASASPQRHRILRDAGYGFEIASPGDAEDGITSAPSIDELAIARARVKALHVAEKLKPPFPAVVIGSDTVVALGDDVIGKPLDRCDAVAILTRLSGSRHRVISGLCLWPVRGGAADSNAANPREMSLAATTWIQMRPMSAAEIDAYVATGQSDGKAGAYAIQETGDQFVESLEGSLLNVVGFPLEDFERLLPRACQAWRFCQ